MTDDTSKLRKMTPVFRGFMHYFPDAMMAVAHHSFLANEKHNPGEQLHWSKGKSNDHLDCLARHLLDTGKFDEEFGDLHDVAIAWRAMANLQTVIEQRRERGEPLSMPIAVPTAFRLPTPYEPCVFPTCNTGPCPCLKRGATPR